MQIIKDVYMAAGCVYGENSNVYIIDAGDELLLIDCGYDDEQADTVLKTMETWKLSRVPVTRAFVTHCHFDHAGNARYFEQRGTVIYAGREDTSAIRTGDERTIGFAFMGKKFMPCTAVNPVSDGDKIKAGNVEIEAIAVPGHTKGSMMYRMKKEGIYLLFTGDSLLIKENCRDAVLGWNGSPDYDKAAYLDSIRKIKDLKADVLLPGHGMPCLRDGHRLLGMLYKEALVHLR